MWERDVLMGDGEFNRRIDLNQFMKPIPLFPDCSFCVSQKGQLIFLALRLCAFA
jgi:hypothetical protein